MKPLILEKFRIISCKIRSWVASKWKVKFLCLGKLSSKFHIEINKKSSLCVAFFRLPFSSFFFERVAIGKTYRVFRFAFLCLTDWCSFVSSIQCKVRFILIAVDLWEEICSQKFWAAMYVSEVATRTCTNDVVF